MSKPSTSKTDSSISSCADVARRRTLAALCAVAATAAAATACGYRLDAGGRGARFVAPSLARMSLEGLPRYAPLRVALKSALRGHGVRVVAPGAASAHLALGDENVMRRMLAVGDDAKAREYLLRATVEFSVRAEDGRTLIAKQRVHSEGSYLYDDENPSGSESERRRTLEHVRRDLARRIIGRLAAFGAR